MTPHRLIIFVYMEDVGNIKNYPTKQVIIRFAIKAAFILLEATKFTSKASFDSAFQQLRNANVFTRLGQLEFM